MYPPPPKETIRQLLESELDTVCYCRYMVHLTFENGSRLSLEGPFRFAQRGELSTAPVNEFPLCEPKLTRVLGCKVIEINCDTDGTLDLEFSNGDALIVYANDPAYEAYTLQIDGKEYVV